MTKLLVNLFFIVSIMVIVVAAVYLFSDQVEIEKPIIEEIKPQYKFITIESGDLVPTQEYLDLEKRIAEYPVIKINQPDFHPKLKTYQVTITK